MSWTKRARALKQWESSRRGRPWSPVNPLVPAAAPVAIFVFQIRMNLSSGRTGEIGAFGGRSGGSDEDGG